MKRHKTKIIKIGKTTIGGNAPIRVQSMTNTKTSNIKATIAQIKRLEAAGCELVRCGVPDMKSAKALKTIKSKIKIPLIADIHFDYRLAIESLKNGADKIRINPGNIGSSEKVLEVIKAAKKAKASIRIGVNAGSLKNAKSQMPKAKYKNKTVNRMVDSLMEHVKFFEKNKFTNVVVSLKASDIMTTVEAYRMFSKLRRYPLHIGITEAGTELSGTIKSSAGLALLLSEGLGDTLRVSLTAEPEQEVYTAYRILDTLGIRKYGAEIISCPTCARTEINIMALAKKVEKMTMGVKKPVKIAVMGCSVNGPGEAKHADLGVSGGREAGLIFKKGKIIKKVKKKGLLKEFEKEVKKL